MKYSSTRGKSPSVGISDALEAGIAPDGGLFVPEKLPSPRVSDFDGLESLAEIGAQLLEPFFAGDEILGPALPEICRRAFSFPVPLVPVPGREGDYFLELFHGPTSAFKDVGARFLASCLEERARAGKEPSERTVIVATSGDTGGAVAAAFHGRPGLSVVVLYPQGRISPRQEKQLCCWGGNVRAFAVRGSFDDCQRVVKEALLDSDVAKSLGLSWLSANSINLGRILPQMTYYARASLLLSRGKKKGRDAPGFIVPSGNLGNSLASLWAKAMGFPMGRVILALNSNRGVADFVATGAFQPAPAVATLANAMDVGNPSNLERLRSLYPSIESLRADVGASWASDDEIREEIRASGKTWGQVLCPHTATAAIARKRIDSSGARGSDGQNWVLVATAHPAKFETIVEPLVGHSIPIPPGLAAILGRPGHSEAIEPTYAALRAVLL